MIYNKSTQDCEKTCIIAVLESLNLNSGFYNLVNRFINDLQKQNSCAKKKYTEFVNKLISYKYICCEIGMQYMEAFIFDSAYYNVFWKQQSDKNNFVNNKIVLYEWISFKHLEICVEPKSNDLYAIYFEYEIHQRLHIIAKKLNNIEHAHTPNKKVLILLDIVQSIFEIIELCKDTDLFLSLIIFIVIKSQVKNILLHITFIEVFLREPLKICQNKCLHLVSVDKSRYCTCLNAIKYSNNEVLYYLTSFKAAIVFIERLEYSSLCISEIEFNKKILLNVKNLKNADSQPVIIYKKKSLSKVTSNFIMNMINKW
ncbi:hypothetical protein BDAP_000523 [Binucleata daphniae]